MYSADDRTRLREALVTAALADRRFGAVALCGSGAVGREDAWSDIDLLFGVADAADFAATVADWTAMLYRDHGALHHVEIRGGAAVYRAFLLPSTLQVDLNFVPASEFGPRGPKFRLLSGAAGEPAETPVPTAGHLAGMGWLYAEQARSCLRRRTLWQAERMIAGVREQALALACLRHGLPALQGAGVDSLPGAVLAAYGDCLVGAIEAGELAQAFRAAVGHLNEEIREADPDLHERLAGPLAELVAAEGA